MTKAINAQESFKKGYACSQAVLTAFSGEFGLDKDISNRIACGFGGGIARRSLTCGAVSGAFMVIGLKYGKYKDDDNESKEITYKKINEFSDLFEKEFGSINCGQLLCCDLSKKEGMQKFIDEGLFNKKCMIYVKKACEILESMGPG